MTAIAPTTNQDALALLRQRYPWPQERPDFAPIDWSMDGGGRWLVQEKLRRREFNVVLEIGCFLGDSIRTWLAASSELQVVAVDPWPESWDLAQYARDHGKSDSVVSQFARPHGFYQTFLTNLWDQRDRVIPVREYSPAILYELSETSLRPDLIFLDSDKTGKEIELCHRLFPGAVMTGDDWDWKNETGETPIRKPVKEFCEAHGRYLKVENQTWVIDIEPPSLRFRLRTWRRSVRGNWKARRRAAA